MFPLMSEYISSIFLFKITHVINQLKTSKCYLEQANSLQEFIY